MRTRAFVRAIPRSPVSIAFDQEGEPHAYGAVANISEGGACVWTEASLEVGQEVSLRLSGARRPQPLEVSALVAWTGGRSSRTPDTRRYGLQWMPPSEVSRAGVRRLIGV